MSTDIIKLKSTADILGGDIFFATSEGFDPEHTSNGDLLPNGMYIRLEGSDGSLAYISAYELDKVLETINALSENKADKSDVDALQTLLEGKASDADLELLQNDVATKASKSELEEALKSVSNKVDQSAIDELINQISTKADSDLVELLSEAILGKADNTTLESLSTTVSSKADADDVNEMLADLNALKETVQLLSNTDAITAINTQITALTNAINKKLENSDLQSIITNVNSLQSSSDLLNERIGLVEDKLNKKATTTYVQGQLSEMNSQVNSLSKQVSAKADKSDVAVKANKSDYDTLVKKVTGMNTILTELNGEVDAKITEFTTALSNKADANFVNTKVNEFIENLNSKVDRATFNNTVNTISTNLQSIETTTSTAINEANAAIENLECEVNNTLSEVRASVNTQSKTISSHSTEIEKLRSSSNTYNEQLKQTWVRVLSSNEYKKLTTPPDGVPYNPRYKYPNTVYLVVDFNKPKAIYIGDILVAKSEQNGSVGFAYTFPIIF